MEGEGRCDREQQMKGKKACEEDNQEGEEENR
jgi:hypothetical protein